MTAGKPSKSQSTKPIADRETIARLRQILRRKPRDLLLFDLAVQTGLDMSLLLKLRVKDLQDLPPGAPLPGAASRMQSISAPVLTRQCRDTFLWYMQTVNPSPGDYLFASRKGGGPLNLPSVSHIIKKWFNDAGLSGLSGARSLKKTWEVFYRAAGASNTGSDAREDPTHILKPVETRTVQEMVYQELFGAIISGRIAPGERLVTEKIANQMRVSPMPVREALYRLQAAGLVITRRKVGSVVAKLSLENLKEIMEIRLALEPMAAAKAVKNIDKKILTHLEKVHAAYLAARQASDIEKFLAMNRKFHHSIYRQAEMPILLPIIDGLWGRISPYLHILMREQGYTGSQWVVETHEGMLKAMKKSDSAKMVACVRDDLTTASKALVEMFDHAGR